MNQNENIHDVERTSAQSASASASELSSGAAAPNVLIVVLDDLGFAQLGCFGSDIATPNIDNLAARGLRYNNFHATPACAPSRACLITGRNSHAVGMGFLPEAPLGFPGYNARIPKSAGTLPRLLRDSGYNTFAVGKWHLTPRFDTSAAGPFDRWPLGMGFERYYGFEAQDPASGNQWAPNHMVNDNTLIEPPRSPDEGYHLTEDLADQAIRLIQDQQQAAPSKPFFMYFSPFAVHEPHHVPAEWVKPYRNQFDDGWEAWRSRAYTKQRQLDVVPSHATLTERPPWIRPWAGLSDSERRLYAQQMETFAGFLTHTDAQIGRLIDFLEAVGILDDTLIVVVSDNGASAEGGPHGHVSRRGVDDVESMTHRIDDLGGPRSLNHYAWGWAWAGNTPFRLWKRYAHLGGVRVPMIAHWPAGISADCAGQSRAQFGHMVDLMPTVLEAAGVDTPDVLDGVSQQRVDGKSLLATFTDPGSPSPRNTQYFEMMGSRAIYHDGWKATTNHVDSTLDAERELIEGSHDFDQDRWALFHLEHDFSEAHDVSAEHPDKLRKMIELWWHEAGRNQVLPLTDGWLDRLAAMEPSPHANRSRYVYRPGGGSVVTPWSYLAGFQLVAGLDVPDKPPVQGIVCAQGDWHGGWACYFMDNRLVFVLTCGIGSSPHTAYTDRPISPGRHDIGVTYTPGADRCASVSIALDGQELAKETTSIDELTLPMQFGFVGKLSIGRDQGLPVSEDYRPPFPFTGHIHHVVVDVPATQFAEPSHADQEQVLRND